MKYFQFLFFPIFFQTNALCLYFMPVGYRNYKKLLKDAPAAPTIPYLGLFLREITHICDGNPKIIEKEDPSTETGADLSAIGMQKEEEGEGEEGEEREEGEDLVTEDEIGGEDIERELHFEGGEEEEGEGGDESTVKKHASFLKGRGDAEGEKVKQHTSVSNISDHAADAEVTHHNWERVLLLGSRISEVTVMN